MRVRHHFIEHSKLPLQLFIVCHVLLRHLSWMDRERVGGGEREGGEKGGGGGGAERERAERERERERERLSHVAPLLLFVVPRTNLWLCLNSWLLSEGVTVWPTAFFWGGGGGAILKFIYSSFVPMLYFGSNSYWTYLSKKLTCPH